MQAPFAPPNDAQANLRSLQDVTFLKTRKYEEQQWRAVREGGHLLIVEFEKAFLKRLKAEGIPAYCHAMVRTKEDQRKAFKGGFSNFDGSQPFVHEHCAVDVVHSKFHWNMARSQWLIFGFLGKEVAKLHEIDIIWGGDWKSKRWPEGDPAHWELANWRERAKEVLR